MIAFLIIIIGCQKKINFVYNVPPEFEPPVQRFITEAKARGYNISIDNLIVQYTASISSQHCANSNVITSKKDVQKIIYINPQTCWLNDIQLETLIFHELGHCMLGRNHDASLLPKGDPKTIMCPDNITLYSPCIYAVADSCNKLYRRTYYLDELFDPLVPVPDWGK